MVIMRLPKIRILLCCLLAYMGGSFSFSSYAMADKPPFCVGGTAWKPGQNPIDLGYVQVSAQQVLKLAQPRYVVIPYPQGSGTFSILEGGHYPQGNGPFNARIHWLDSAGKEKIISAVVPCFYVHSSWLVRSPVEKKVPETIADWLVGMRTLSDTTTCVTEKYFTNLVESVTQDLLEQCNAGRWYADDNIVAHTAVEDACWHVQKLAITQEDTVFFFGDLHGDIEALMHGLQDLQDSGFLNNDYTLKKNTYLVFLGDYTDRGFSGVEVLTVLLQLKKANPEQVILLRGNHEQVAMNARWGLYSEFVKKFSPAAEHVCEDLLCELYDALPVALYIGFENEEGSRAWALCCHGGPEIGFSARDFLKSESTHCLIRTLDRDGFIQQLPDDLRRAIVAASPVSPINDVADGADTIQSESVSGSAAELIGFMWNDFIATGSADFVHAKGRGVALGKRLTHELLVRDGIAFVMRGHQHSGDFLQKLYTYGGHVQLCDETVSTLISGNIDPRQRALDYAYVGFSYKESAVQIGWCLDSYFFKSTEIEKR